MAAGAAAIVACGGATTTEVDSGPIAADSSYGGPRFDSGGADTMPVPFYGGVSFDSSVPDASDAGPKDAGDGG